jgi:uncharacterized protein (DUF1800 family)
MLLRRRTAGRSAASLALGLMLLDPGTARAGATASEDAAVIHVLNRLAYGPRPGDVEKVKAMGLEKWIAQQLEPRRIADPAVGPLLARLETAELSSHDLLKGYEVPRAARREIAQKQAEMADASEDSKREARRELMQQYGSQMQGTPRQVIAELQEAKVVRAVHSERQLDEVLVDFWLNHFNVYAQKGPVKFLVGEYERDALRPHAWGRFEDLLLATAESPAMLFYLDNWLSSDPTARPTAMGTPGARRGRLGAGSGGQTMRRPADDAPQGRGRKRGLNENYAREIMELHTLGVEGGYTQKDVTEVARCFTGWTIKGLRNDRPEFQFEPRFHDNGDKVVLGQTIKAAGRDEGRKVIHLLATQPATARFISTKLVRRFVADEPPADLVERAATVFKKTDGDIREVVRAIVTSPEFLGGTYRNAKVKTPLEFVVSAVRASGAAVDDPIDLAKRIAAMGMPLYMQQPPTGYKDTADAWVSTSGLLARLNFALDLAGGRVVGVRVDTAKLAGGASEGVAAATAMAARLVPQGLSDSTRKTIDGEENLSPARMAGLVLGSPEFQRR